MKTPNEKVEEVIRRTLKELMKVMQKEDTRKCPITGRPYVLLRISLLKNLRDEELERHAKEVSRT